MSGTLSRKKERIVLDLEELIDEVRDGDVSDKLEKVVYLLKEIYVHDPL